MHITIPLPKAFRWRWRWSRDDWQEQPRVPAGSSEGGQFASTGGGAGGLTLPGKIGSGQYHTTAVAKLEKAAHEGYAKGGKQGAIEAVTEAAKGFKHHQVQGYATKLKKIIAEHPEQMEGPPEQAPPSEAEIEQMAKEEPSASKLPEPSGAMQEHFHELASDEGVPAEQRIEALKKAAKGWPQHGGYINSLIMGLGGTAFTPAAEPEPVKQGLPEPQTNSQATVHKIVNNAGLSVEEKIAAIQAKMEHYQHQPNKEYAEKALAQLQGTEAPWPTPEEIKAASEPKPAEPITLPEPEKDNYKQLLMHTTATATEMSLESRVEFIKNTMAGTLSAKNKEYGQSLLDILKGESAAPEPKPAAQAIAEAKQGVIPEIPEFLKTGQVGEKLNNMKVSAEHGATAKQIENYLQQQINIGAIQTGSAAHGYAKAVLQAKQAQEAEAIHGKPELQLPEPQTSAQNAIHAVATGKEKPPAGKTVEEYLKLVHENTQVPDTKEYAGKALEALGVKTEAKAEAATPEAHGLKPIPIENHPNGISEIPPPPLSKNPAAMKAYQIVSDPKKDIWTKYDDLDQLEKSSAGEGAAYAKQVKEIIGPMPGGTFFGNEEASSAAKAGGTSNIPEPPLAQLSAAGQTKAKAMHTVATTEMPLDKKIAAIKQIVAVTPQLQAYQTNLLKSVQSGAGATTAAQPAPTPEPTPQEKATEAMKAVPAPHPDSPGQKNVHAAAQTGTTLPEKIAAVQAAAAKHSGAYTKSYAEEVLKALGHTPEAPKTAEQAKTQAHIPPPSAALSAAPKQKLKPHYKTLQTNTLEDAYGGELEAKLDADSKRVPGDYYHKVSQAYGDTPQNGMTSPVDHAMMQYAHEMAAKRTGVQTSALSAYKGSDYDPINDYLLGKDKVPKKGVKTWIANMRSVMKTEVVPANTPVYRGLRVSLKGLTGFDNPDDAVGRSFVHRNFASTSRDIKIAESFAGSYGDSCLMHLTLPAGMPGAVLRDQDGYEREIVLPDHCGFRIDKVEVNPKGSATRHTLHVTYIGQTDPKITGVPGVV